MPETDKCPTDTVDLQLGLVDFVSFDFFDTLVCRPTVFAPKDVFYHVQVLAEEQFGQPLPDFAILRIRAEKVARARAWGQGKPEVTLDEIYRELAPRLDCAVEVTQRLIEIELDAERSIVRANRAGKQLFDICRVAGKHIVIVSDTYFKKEFLHELLLVTGYKGPWRIFASSDYRKTKVDGCLFDMVLGHLKCRPGNVLHIGDNTLSDVTMALGRGIRVFLLPNRKQELKWRHGLGDRPSGNPVMSAMLSHVSEISREPSEKPDFQSVLTRTGVEHVSLLFFAFACWLLQQLVRDDCPTVYFASREGRIMQRFFDLVASATGKRVDSRYLYVSRAALYPTMIFSDPEGARRLFSQSWNGLPLSRALRRMSLDFEICKEPLWRHGLKSPNMPVGGPHRVQFMAFLEEMWTLVSERNRHRYDLAIQYLSQEGVLNGEKAAFVDIGWHGSLQRCVNRTLRHLNIPKDLGGYYLATFLTTAGPDAAIESTGFLLNEDKPDRISQLVRTGPSLLELLHSADHGSVLGYERNGNHIRPLLEDNPEEMKQYREIIAPIQDAAYAFVSDQIKRVSVTTLGAPAPDLVAPIALRPIYQPTVIEAQLLGTLKHASDFGAKMVSVTGVAERDLRRTGEDGQFPDGTNPMWKPGYHSLKIALESKLD